MALIDLMKGVNGNFEVTRVVGAVGAMAYIFGANGFEGWQIFGLHHDFDLTSYCLSFPTGLGVAVGAISASAGWKDRQTAKAVQTRDGTNQPAAAPPEGAD
jgi:hypothetical protein